MIPLRTLAALVFIAPLLGSCQLFVASDIGLGLGRPCETADDCQGASCVEGVCASKCDSQPDCPGNLICTAGYCQAPLQASFIYLGPLQDEGWTLTHEAGRHYAEEHLSYLRTEVVADAYRPEDASAAIDKFVAGGSRIIVANSFSLREPVKGKAEQYPDVQFLTCSSNENGPNMGTFFARSYQSWYLAGYTAAQKSKTKRLGFLGSFVTPEVVRHINAFTRGAQRFEPDIKVEVRWEGFWFDIDEPDPVTGKYDEEEITEQLVTSGCDVIAHNSDNSRAVATVEALRGMGEDVYSIGNDNPNACEAGPTSCLGVPYWNWGPLYARMFDDIRRGRWNPWLPVNENIRVDPEQSITNFFVNTKVAGSGISVELGEILADMADSNGESIPWRAVGEKYCSTGQRDNCVEVGQRLSDPELASMCWFVEGVVEREDPTVAASPDKPALVPDGKILVPSVPSYPPGSQIKPDCRVNQ